MVRQDGVSEQQAFTYEQGVLTRRRSATYEDLAARQAAAAHQQTRTGMSRATTTKQPVQRLTEASYPPASPHRVGHFAGLHPEDQPYLTQERARSRSWAEEEKEESEADEPSYQRQPTSARRLASPAGESMMQIEENNTRPPVTATEPISEPLKPLAGAKLLESAPLACDDEPIDVEALFTQYLSDLDTQPLPKLKRKRPLDWQTLLGMLLSVSMIGTGLLGIVWSVLTYPTVTVTLVPVEKPLTMATALSISLRQLAPVTLSRSMTAPTTGKGHQDARAATGTLTFYNGLFTPQPLPRGTVFTGRDGVQVTTDESIIIPKASPPQFAEASVTAHTLEQGAAGNIQVGDITATIANGVLVKNSAFHGGQDARDFPVVAQRDLDSLIARVHQALSQQLSQAFVVRSGETLHTANCLFKATPNHERGAEALMVQVNVSQMCSAVAYHQEALQQQATAAFTTHMRPAPAYELLGPVQTTIVSVTPLLVTVAGVWVYTITQDAERHLATHLAGDTPAQAKAYLLKTGIIAQATLTRTLPNDPDHIHFLVLVEVSPN